MPNCTASRLCKRPGVIVAGSRLTPCLEHLKKKGARKFKNRPEWSDLANRRFDSAGERRRGEELKALEKAGEIWGLRYQVRYDLAVNGVKVCGYVADFVYYVNKRLVFGEGTTPVEVVEDYKGYETPEFRIKAKLFRAIHGYDITIVRPPRKNFAGKK